MGAPRGVRALADEIYDTLMAASPVEATLLGDRRFDGMLPDVTPDGLAATVSTLERLSGELERTDTAAPGDRVTADVATHVLAHARHELGAGYVEFAAGPMTSGATIGSPASALLINLPKVAVDGPTAGDAYLARCAAIPEHLRAAEDQLRAGVASGRVAAARLVAATVRQIDRYLATAGEDDPLLHGSFEWPAPVLWRTTLQRELNDHIHPAFARHRTVLAEEIAPRARRDEQAGLCWVPDGESVYHDAARLHTTTSSTPQDLHDLGRDLIDGLGAEYQQVGDRALGTTDVGEIFDRLRGDPALRFASAEQIVRQARAALDRAQAALGEWFATVPGIPCEVHETPAVEAPESTMAYYHPPAIDGSRPGRYFVNTFDPTSRLRFEAEALAFHESVPGHHTQIARAQELDLPVLQRVFYVTAFVEGWALYAERLADEMGLYTDDVARLGMLSFDSWRACRLVVDTGIHAFGWSRSRAVEFMRANSPQAIDNIVNEVDRYIGWPGQALAYMTGRTRIVALRRRAERALGSRFDIARFHDVLLERAAVPLWTLERLVGDWIAGSTAR